MTIYDKIKEFPKHKTMKVQISKVQIIFMKIKSSELNYLRFTFTIYPWPFVEFDIEYWLILYMNINENR